MPSHPTPSERLIVALDLSATEANLVVDDLGETVSFYKVGWQLFLETGWSFVQSLLHRGKKVFLDLKIGDIEETVRAALANMPDAGGGLELLTIHGNGQTVKAAQAGRNGRTNPKILMLTALSSWDDWDVRDFLAHDSARLVDYVVAKARKALEAGCDGLIASGESVKTIREQFKEKKFLIVTPGVRPSGFPQDDHKRTLTPHEAMQYGADYIVVGRPITRSEDSKGVAESIVEEIKRGLETSSRGRLTQIGSEE